MNTLETLKAFRKASRLLKSKGLNRDERIRWWICYKAGQHLYEYAAGDMARIYFENGILPIKTVKDAVEYLMESYACEENVEKTLKDLIEEFMRFYG